MKTCAVLFLLIPALAVSDTARPIKWNLGGFHQSPQAKPDNIIDGMKKLDAFFLVLLGLNLLSDNLAVAIKKLSWLDSSWREV